MAVLNHSKSLELLYFHLAYNHLKAIHEVCGCEEVIKMEISFSCFSVVMAFSLRTGVLEFLFKASIPELENEMSFVLLGV